MSPQWTSAHAVNVIEFAELHLGQLIGEGAFGKVTSLSSCRTSISRPFRSAAWSCSAACQQAHCELNCTHDQVCTCNEVRIVILCIWLQVRYFIGTSWWIIVSVQTCVACIAGVLWPLAQSGGGCQGADSRCSTACPDGTRGVTVLVMLIL